MTGISLAAATILQASLLMSAQPYKVAYQQMQDTGRPLVVLVGAEWCPHCVTMENSVMPQLARRGLLDKVAFSKVNTDRDGELARKLMRGGSIPQLVMYRKTADGWRRTGLIGGQSVEQVEAFIQQGLKDTVIMPVASQPTETEAEEDKTEKNVEEKEETAGE